MIMMDGVVMTPASPNNSAFRRFIDTPELFRMVIMFIHDKQVFSALAQTCQATKEVALNALWSHLGSLTPLLLLLSPLTQDSEGIWDFVDPRITPHRWDIYARYSLRVTSINIHFDDKSLSFASSVFVAMGHTRPDNLPLLPNLRSLFLRVPTERIMECIPFFSKTLLNLDLWIQSDQASVQYVYQSLLTRSPMLQKFCLETRFVKDAMRESVLNLLLGLQNIQEVVLPSSNLTPATLTALSHIHSVQTIKIRRGAVGTLDFRPFQPKPFRGLRHLCMRLPLEATLPLMADSNWAPELTRVEIESQSTTPGHVEAFTTAVARSLPKLTTLVLDLFDSSTHHHQRSPTLNFEALQPLLGCGQMSEFFIRHRLYIHLEPEDLQRILLKWPQLKSLYFCLDAGGTAAQPEDFGFSFDILLHFARMCPQIERLGLRFKSNTSPGWTSGARLEKLKQLHFCSSTLKGPKDLALFLSCLCKISLVFGFGEYSYGSNSPGPSGYRVSLEREEEVRKHFLEFCTIRQRVVVETTKETRELRRELMKKGASLELQRDLHGGKVDELQKELENERSKRLELELELDELRRHIGEWALSQAYHKKSTSEVKWEGPEVL